MLANLGAGVALGRAIVAYFISILLFKGTIGVHTELGTGNQTDIEAGGEGVSVSGIVSHDGSSQSRKEDNRRTHDE